MKKLVFLAFLLLLLSGCTTYRPQYDADYEKAVSAVIDKSSETIKFNDHAVWFPNQSTIQVRPIFALQAYNDGNIVITDQTLYFMEWDSNSNEYNTVRKIDFTNVKNVKLVEFGPSRRFVIQSNSDRFDMFSFVTSEIYDSEKNIEAYKYINSLIKKSPEAQERH